MNNKTKTLSQYEVRIFDEPIKVEALNIYDAKKEAAKQFKLQHPTKICVSGLIAIAHVKVWK